MKGAMAHISRKRNKDGSYSYRAHVHRNGQLITKGGYKSKKDAARWGREQERSIDNTGLPLTIEELKKHKASDIIDRYLKDVTPTKASAKTEAYFLERFKQFVGHKSLAYISKTDGIEYR